ncbi:hypothetical protein SAMD00019534_119880 [Acytostelium subglobosum LB1]|uniref:hypothetical protein n=1 Tax=Acytostelium subglobosum LB1 TaxID=1410327 RepID=UPI00064486A1|nr:hypothetical protein SAMD00019534_119880 [Acytostelium subglobosum LB1]GAM28812.1 hypothetical protein SAMD00019534_119880 [Acytostelium subglobosum LB1]|eukprot:XP_012748184.1 hypothetical protein SAMD00019534_119880 [Acytostelium subglobosum LB1]
MTSLQNEQQQQQQQQEDIRIGDRLLSDDGYFGTVMYIGDVDGFQGQWYGVCWDSATRGKHKGTIKQRAYFECAYDGSGSFMKLDKLIRGRTLLDAIVTKFSDHVDHSGLGNIDRNTPIEMIGMEKVREQQKTISKQTVIVANNLTISSIDPPSAIAMYLGENLLELNLSQNLISRWSDVGNLVTQTSKLERLTLSENRLLDDLNPSKLIQSSSSSGVKALFLNHTKTGWDTACRMVHILFPHLEVLGLHGNSISTLHLQAPNTVTEVFKHLKSLDLSNNSINQFTTLLEGVALIDSLQELNLSKNLLDNITFPTTSLVAYDELIQGGKQTLLFSGLSTLFLSNNLIADTSSIDSLDQLPSLTELSLRDNPIIDYFHSQSTTASTSSATTSSVALPSSSNDSRLQNEKLMLNRMNIIPRISRLHVLNLTNITTLERSDSERYLLHSYFKHHQQLDNNSNNNDNDFHPTKMEYLKRLHGETLQNI